MPGQPGRAQRALQNIPRQFTLWEPPALSDDPHRSRESATIPIAELTLRERGRARNTKPASPCEEAVEDQTSLWKAPENLGLRGFHLARIPTG